MVVVCGGDMVVVCGGDMVVVCGGFGMLTVAMWSSYGEATRNLPWSATTTRNRFTFTCVILISYYRIMA